MRDCWAGIARLEMCGQIANLSQPRGSRGVPRCGTGGSGGLSPCPTRAEAAARLSPRPASGSSGIDGVVKASGWPGAGPAAGGDLWWNLPW